MLSLKEPPFLNPHLRQLLQAVFIFFHIFLISSRMPSELFDISLAFSSQQLNAWVRSTFYFADPITCLYKTSIVVYPPSSSGQHKISAAVYLVNFFRKPVRNPTSLRSVDSHWLMSKFTMLKVFVLCTKMIFCNEGTNVKSAWEWKPLGVRPLLIYQTDHFECNSKLLNEVVAEIKASKMK